MLRVLVQTALAPAASAPLDGGMHWVAPVTCAGAGLGLVLAAAYARRRHWAKVRATPGAGETSAVWTDVLLQLVRALGGLLLVTALLMGGLILTRQLNG